MTAPTFLHTPADTTTPIARLMLAHGAGAPMTSPFLDTIAAMLAARGIEVVRFEFGYMAARRNGGKKRPAPKAETLAAEYTAAVEHLAKSAIADPVPLFIGGKSMGGRVASLVADQLHSIGQIAGTVCLGYPFHPPGMPEKLRTAHLEALQSPLLMVQGERDPFGSREEVESYRLSPRISIHWAGDGDHDLGPRGGHGFTRRGNLEAAADACISFAARSGT